MAQRLKGKSAIVTGGGGGIGRAAALALAEEGAKVVINDVGKNPDGGSFADMVVAEIKKAGGEALANKDSVSSMAGGQNMVNAAVSAFGRIDILVNCAGNFLLGSIVEMKESDWDAVIAVHMKGHFSCTQAAAREMIKQKSGGSIINISSSGAFNFVLGPVSSIAYGAAKAGIMGMTAGGSAQLKPHGITVNCLLPGAITKLFPHATKARGFGITKREGPEFVAPLIVYLASDEAKNITGQYFYCAGEELALYHRPFQLPGPHMYVRRQGKWTFEELAEVIPSMVGQG